MAFRAIYIIDSKHSKDKSKRVTFKRSFPVIEKKCQRSQGPDVYRKIPLDFPQLMLEELRLIQGKDEFIPKFDSCARNITHPVYSLLEGSLYPIIAFQKDAYVYCCIVYDNEDTFQKTKLIIDSPGVILALTMLENMSKLLKKGQSISDKTLESLNKYVNLGFPFGVPMELDLSTVLKISSTAEGAPLPKTKGPTWRPVAFKGKQTLQLTINEVVKGLQFDHAELVDKCDVYGTVTLKAEVEESPEISLNFSCPVETGAFNQMVYHPTVQYIDELPLVMKNEGSKSDIQVQYGAQKIRFCPPNEEFTLCHYKVSLPQSNFPVKIFYQMKGDLQSVKVMIQLNLSDKMKNDFERFNVQIPFFNRGAISDFTCLTSSANVYMLNDKSTLLWNIGSKFPGKSRELTLDVEVTFECASAEIAKPHAHLHGLDSYIQVIWSINDFTYSGLFFDTKSVELFPSSRVKITSASSFRTLEYKVWNSHGGITDTTFSS